MSDWKSLMVAFVPDREIPGFSGDSIFDIWTTEALNAAQHGGHIRTFDTVAYDYQMFADPFLRAYGLPDATSLKQHCAAADGDLLLLPAARLAEMQTLLDRFFARFEDDPDIAAATVRAADQSALDLYCQVSAEEDPPAWLREKQQKAQTLWRRELWHAPIDGARMVGLYEANAGQGYLPDAVPEAANALFSERPSNLLRCAFQAFGYLKALRGWCDVARNRSLLEVIW